jgi:TM2 domain-containing membrane protein YozV
MKSETETESSVKSKFGDEVDRLFPVTTAKELEKSPFPAFRKKLRREPVELEPPPKPLTQNDIALILMQKKNPGVAAVLSFFWAGLGQIYNGQIAKGIVLMIVQVINVLLMFVLIGFLTYPLVWLLGIVDAYRTAQQDNEWLLRGEFS